MASRLLDGPTSDVVWVVKALTVGDWTSSNPAFAVSRKPRGPGLPYTSSSVPAFPTCYGPLPVSLPGKSGGFWALSSVSHPICEGNLKLQ
jgi:hypothetical protein